MKQMIPRTCAVLGVMLLVFGLLGCAKRVPLEGGAFEAQQRVLVTLKDGRSLRGYIAPDQRVDYRDHGTLYRATVAEVSADDIRLEDLVQISSEGSFADVSARLADARTRLGAPLPPVTVSRSDIGTVELIRFDVYRALRNAAFWGYGGALFVLLLGQRS
jgi:hypothetical protein